MYATRHEICLVREHYKIYAGVVKYCCICVQDTHQKVACVNTDMPEKDLSDFMNEVFPMKSRYTYLYSKLYITTENFTI